MGKRVLITGVDGFTGRYLAAALAAAGHEVHGLAFHTPTQAVPGVSQLHVGDLADADRMIDMVREVQPQKVAHLAGIAFVAHGDAEAMYRSNLLGTRCLLEALSKLSSAPEAILLASSANVYGNSTEGVLDELTAPRPTNDYAVSKLAMEYVARLYTDRLPIVIARPFNYTGVGQSESFLLPKIVSHARRAAPVIELGNLDVARDFSDVRMVVEAYARLLDTASSRGQTFNVCSGVAYTLNEVLSLVRSISGVELNVLVNPAFVRPNEVKTLLGTRARLEKCIGTLTRIDLSETLRWMISA
jgi:GDP-6-deoxy-D-talose 4-dehydrogenase